MERSVAGSPLERLQRVLVELERHDYDKSNAVVDDRCPLVPHLVQRVEECLCWRLVPGATWWGWMSAALDELCANIEQHPELRTALVARDVVSKSHQTHDASGVGRVWLVKMFNAAKVLHAVVVAAFDMPDLSARYFHPARGAGTSEQEFFLVVFRNLTRSFHFNLDTQHANIERLFSADAPPFSASETPSKVVLSPPKPPKHRVVRRVKRGRGRGAESPDTSLTPSSSLPSPSPKSSLTDDAAEAGISAEPVTPSHPPAFAPSVSVEMRSQGCQAVEAGRELGLLLVDASEEEIGQLRKRQARYDSELASYEALEAGIARREEEMEGKVELLQWAQTVERRQTVELLTQLASLHQRVLEAEARAAEKASGYTSTSFNSSLAPSTAAPSASIPKPLFRRIVHVLDLATNGEASTRLGYTAAPLEADPRALHSIVHHDHITTSLRTAHTPVNPREAQLALQGHRCADCKAPIQNNQLLHKPRRCFYTGSLYCNNCHHSKALPLPALIVHDFDFSVRKVCVSAHQFLTSIEHAPVLVLSQLNPKLFERVPRLASSVDLRRRLLRCLQIVRRVVPTALVNDSHEYLLTHPESYSVADLVLIHGKEHATHTSLLKSLQARLLSIARKEGLEGDVREILEA